MVMTVLKPDDAMAPFCTLWLLRRGQGGAGGRHHAGPQQVRDLNFEASFVTDTAARAEARTIRHGWEDLVVD
jgi:hypothetical protein